MPHVPATSKTRRAPAAHALPLPCFPALPETGLYSILTVGGK
jgi:hypothetical protein